jgi:hypothetical protein
MMVALSGFEGKKPFTSCHVLSKRRRKSVPPKVR